MSIPTSRRLGQVILSVYATLAIIGITAAPAHADDGWRHREWRRHEWREHEWREHAWRRGYYPGYYPAPYAAPGYAYPAPGYVYAPPPPVVYAPVPAPGINVVVPLQIR